MKFKFGKVVGDQLYFKNKLVFVSWVVLYPLAITFMLALGLIGLVVRFVYEVSNYINDICIDHIGIDLANSKERRELFKSYRTVYDYVFKGKYKDLTDYEADLKESKKDVEDDNDEGNV